MNTGTSKGGGFEPLALRSDTKDMSVADELGVLLQKYKADDEEYRQANFRIGIGDAMRPLTQANKTWHQTEINKALVTRANKDEATHAALLLLIEKVRLLEAPLPSKSLYPGIKLFPG